MTLAQNIILCSVAAGLLGLREAFRFRLLMSAFAMLSTLLAVICLLGWLGLLIASFAVLPFFHALLVFLVPFIVGNAVRLLARNISRGSGFFSPERCAEQEYEKKMASHVATESASAENLAGLVSRFQLAPSDFELLFNRLKGLGLTHTEAMRAMTQPKVIEYYFERVGRESAFTAETSMELILLARNEMA